MLLLLLLYTPRRRRRRRRRRLAGAERGSRLLQAVLNSICDRVCATQDALEGRRPVQGVETLEDTARTARRVLGGAHPMVGKIERNLKESRAALRARETPPTRTDAREDGDLDEVDDA